uniref:7TM_GPCR_Srx domain-containing protein n=1 Tax=Steinernema glaseri TaxID=37863 RepID=A0A1I7ZH33_9BILA
MMTQEEWEGERRPNLILGYFYLVIGIFFLIPYVPCLTVMLKQELFKFSCYKIMFFLGLVDFITLNINAVLTGVLTIQGAVFCTSPNIIFVSGSLSMSLWCTTCMGCVLLAFNRCVDLWRPKLMVSLFSDNMTYLWLCLPVGYFCYFFFFTHPVLYTARAYAWFFDPYFDFSSVHVDRRQYTNLTHTINNLTVVALLFLLYTFLSASIWYKARNTHSLVLSGVQRQIVIQSCTICAFNFIAAIIYVYMQFFETSEMWSSDSLLDDEQDYPFKRCASSTTWKDEPKRSNYGQRADLAATAVKRAAEQKPRSA